MHELFEIRETLPIEAGQSPFHIRGLYYSRLLTRAGTLPGGIPRLLDALKDDSVRQFAQQKFNWNRWYDVLPSMPLYAALARIHDRDFEQFVFEGSRMAARELVPRVFRFAARMASPAVLAARVAQLNMHGVDFQTLALDPFQDGRGSGSASGVPLIVAPNMANFVLGWFQGLIEVGGSRVTSARYTDVVSEGLRDGFQTVKIRYEFEWRD